MGKRGPPKTPSVILQLRGSPRGKRETSEPKPDTTTKPKPPAWLRADALPVYRLLSKQLHAMGVLGLTDQVSLARYVTLLVRWVEAETFLEKHGQTWLKRGRSPGKDKRGRRKPGPIIETRIYPQVRIAKGLGEELSKLEDRLGLSPSARANMVVNVPGVAGKDARSRKARHFA